ncbi:MAG: mercuric transport protein [Acidobacteria bacterium]|nr:MAG: mercuric transport protein [Acidobacteriota bacterium]
MAANPTTEASNPRGTGKGWLAAGGVLAILASACCLGPLLFVAVGLGGVWLSHLQNLEPYRPIFLAVAAIALALAYRVIFRSSPACAPAKMCARPPVRRLYRSLFFVVAALLLLAFAFPYLAPVFY